MGRELKRREEGQPREQIHATELEALQEVATQLITAQGMEALYDRILDTALAIPHADLASIQMVHPERGTNGELKLLGYRGFSPQVAKRWEWVGPGSRTASGEALRTGRRVIVPDVRNCDFMAGSEDLRTYLDAGIHSVQTVPLFSRSGGLLGMVTSYWREPYELSVSELRALDVLARLAADAIERTRAEEALRENQALLASIYNTVRDVIFHLTVEPEGQFRFVSVNAAFLRVTGLSREAVVGKAVNEVIPEPSLAMVLGRYRQAIEERTTVLWEESSDYPTGRLTCEVSVTPVFDHAGKCTHLVGSVHDITERKWVENALRSSEQKFAAAFRLGPAATSIVDMENGNRMLDINEGFEKLSGYSRNELLGRRALDDLGLWPEPDEYAHAQRLFEADGTLRDFEFHFRTRNGEIRTGLLSAEPMEINNRRCAITCTIDITERKQVEAALKESEERFRHMADTAPVMLWVTDAEKQFIFVNRTWLQFTGRTLEQEVGTGWAAGIHPDDLQRCFETLSAAFDARRSFQIEMRLRRADGEYRSILCSGVPRFLTGAVFAGYIGSDIDVTDLQSEERFRQLVENIDQVFWMFDLVKERVLYLSPAFEKVWGHRPAVLYNDRGPLLESIHPDDGGKFRAFIEKAGSVHTEGAYRIVRLDGSVRWIQDRAFPILDAEGKPYRVAGIAEDVTSRRELEEELRQAHKMEAVGRLAGGVAHDFNNLLTIMGGYSQMLIDETEVADPKRGRLEEILSATNRATTLTRQLLAFSRRQPLQPKLVHLNHILTSLQALLRPLVGEHIRIETVLDPEVSRILAAPHQIEELVMNLAANSRDAMPHGGEFRMETGMANLPEMPENPARTNGRWVRLRISDTGCGMDDRTREHAFEPFFTTKGVGKGTGLGLSTVYGIVRQNDGEIRLSSAPGKGTTFDLYFPAVLGREAEGELPGGRAAKTPVTGTILVVEDEPALRGLVRHTLEQSGYQVVEAGDGYEAVRIIEQYGGDIDLLLTDVIMPLMNGHELASRVKAMRPATQVLYMSGYTDDVLAFHGIASPEIAFLQKPFTPSELIAQVAAMLGA
jgi:PAS domain S-box-containing protein